MAKPTTTQVRARYETDLSDAALELMIDAADAEMTSRFGPHNSQVDTLLGGYDVLYLTRPADTITEVIETMYGVDTTLAADDYRITMNGAAIKRLSDGTNPSYHWGDAQVTYVPKTDPRRIQVTINLVILAAQFNGLKSEQVGNFSAVHTEYQREKESILSTLTSQQMAYA